VVGGDDDGDDDGMNGKVVGFENGCTAMKTPVLLCHGPCGVVVSSSSGCSWRFWDDVKYWWLQGDWEGEG
jgi:hypothetical protein